MPAKNLWNLSLLLCLLVGSLLACNLLPTSNSSTSSSSTATSQDGTSAPTLNQWQTAATGVEVRYEDWKSLGEAEDTVTIVRFDLKHVRLSVGYQPDQPMPIGTWMKQAQALAVINGGYFDQHNTAESLVVSDGHASGSSYDGFGGMFSVDGQGNVSLRSLRAQPYDPANERLQQATQSSPLLMLHGQRTTFQANAAGQRRSVIAMDKQGRMLLIVSPNQSFTLDELADLLVSSDLSLDTALNLDGGASTGLYLDTSQQKVTVDPLVTLPLVIIVKPA